MKCTPEKNLFVVNTPWQLINANEAISAFNMENNILIVDVTSNLLNTRQIQALIQQDDWISIVYLTSNQSNFLQYAKVIKNCKKNHYDKIFISWSWFTQILFANIVSRDAYIVDDGLATITHYNELQLGKKNYRTFFKKKLRFALFGYKVFTFKKIDFFTSFSLSNVNNIKVKRHDFKRIRDQFGISNFQKNEYVYIIGQPLVEKKMMSQKMYDRYIIGICEHFQGCNIVYIPHRDEKIIFKYFRSFNGLELKTIDQPIELLLLGNKEIPKAIVGFFSSALVNIKHILGAVEGVYYVDIPNKYINKNFYKQVLQNNKSYIVFSKIKKIDLNI
ncbi:alpha-2,8-polysialyltransferase family protein [Candidatus Thioglobus sp.]|nr:alpha-2,8-polysialyltransferase family protein [Candidatus Thioglobus sp.]